MQHMCIGTTRSDTGKTLWKEFREGAGGREKVEGLLMVS